MHVSIVMPSLNQAPFLGDAIGSVLSQTFPAVELIVLDGGSRDGSRGILETVPVPDGKFLHWRSAPDRGQADAVNTGWRMATGALVGWLNSDDLLAPGAVARAVAHFARHPDHVMVYGEALWIDRHGAVIDRYPTLPPDGPLERFQDGCFLCQPTVFLKPAVFAAVGLLEPAFESAMDFDFWVRVFRRFAGRIGHIPTVQALSRLHGATKTASDRKRVMLEGMTVLHRHFGHAPPHWLYTYVNEAMAVHPSPATAGVVPRRLARQVLPLMSPADRVEAKRRLRQDRRLRLVSPRLGLAVFEDGWAADRTEIRLIRAARAETLLISARSARPDHAPLAIAIAGPGHPDRTIRVAGNGPFQFGIRLPPPPQPGWPETVTLQTTPPFVPSLVLPDSGDRRSLGFLIDGITIEG